MFQFRFLFPVALAAICFASTAQAQVEIYRLDYPFVGPSAPEVLVSLANAGDVNADGVSDFVVGTSPRTLPSTVTSRVIVHSGHDGSVLHSFFGDTPGDQFGCSVDGAGDLNGDGHADILVGARRGASGRGYIKVLSGADGSVLFYRQGSATSDRFGHCVASIGDCNGDGLPEFAVSAWSDYPYETNMGSGYVRLFSGANALAFQQFCTCCGSCSGEPSADGFGYTVAAAGDTNGDGAADLIVGSSGFGVSDYPPGFAKLYSGASGSLLGSFSGAYNGENYGVSVAGIGDVNLDGRDDFAIGSPYANTGVGNRPGKVEVRSGQGGGILYTVLANSVSHPQELRMGYSIRPAGDVNNDGISDFLIGSQFFNAPYAPASSLCSGVDGAALRVLEGRAATGVGDWNQDGYSDYALLRLELATGGWYAGSGVRAFLSHAPEPLVYGTPKTNSQGCVPLIRASGAPSLSVGNNFTISADALINQAPGLLIWSLSPAAIPFAGGTLWIGSPIIRTPSQNSGGSPSGVDCSGEMSFPFTQSMLASSGLLPGTRVYCQYYSRDAGFLAPNNVSLTAGLQFIVVP